MYYYYYVENSWVESFLNIDDNTGNFIFFLNSKSALLEWFLKDHMTLSLLRKRSFLG